MVRRRAFLARNPVLSLILVNGLAGAFVALLLVVAILVLDIGGLGTLVAGSDMPVVPVALLTGGFVITFSSVAMGTAIMWVGRDEGGGTGGRPVPVRVRRSVGHV
jgi:hypothetical protein